ncbi:hypothetical protein ACFWPX_29860 [Nocardia sp. NPDC058518]|uniref:hypothetical protein n=1 Tax=Nocardia sp. NPDC058518 TaxID=3346534 RepID=UPI00365FCD5E
MARGHTVSKFSFMFVQMPNFTCAVRGRIEPSRSAVHERWSGAITEWDRGQHGRHRPLFVCHCAQVPLICLRPNLGGQCTRFCGHLSRFGPVLLGRDPIQQ